MFATLLGSLPRPSGPDGAPIADDEAAVVAAIDAQAGAGLDPVTDGRLGPADLGRAHLGRADPDAVLEALEGIDVRGGAVRATASPAWRSPLTVDGWRFAVGHTDRLVKQALPGPYSAGNRLARGDRAMTRALAVALRDEIRALADAGCQLIEIEERDAHRIGSDPNERARFAEAHATLLDGMDGVHCSLAIVGGNADTAGIETILAAPYASLAVDLIDGPDNWRLVTRTPGDRGIICGALSTHHPSDDGPELLLWAASYAASTGGRGMARVGLATAGGLDGLPWTVAERKMAALGSAARLPDMPPGEAVAHLDPRSLDIRSAAMGRYAPRPRRARPGS